MNKHDNPWTTFHDIYNPDDPDDGRVLCWYCAHWTHNRQMQVYYRAPDGSMRSRWDTVRCCDKGRGEAPQGFDPLIPRRCELYKPRPPQYRVRLPDGAFPRGWRALREDEKGV